MGLVVGVGLGCHSHHQDEEVAQPRPPALQNLTPGYRVRVRIRVMLWFRVVAIVRGRVRVSV